MTELFRATKDTLEEISEAQSTDNMGVNPTLLHDLDQLRETVDRELQGNYEFHRF